MATGDGMWRDWLPAIAIAGPILAALITLLASRHFREKKELTFVLLRSEDLAQPLRRYRDKVSFKINEVEVTEFNRGLVWVGNSGNKEIKEPSFQIRIAGSHQLRIIEVRSDDGQLKNAVQTVWGREGNDDVVRIAAPFLNPGERFRVLIFFDGPTVDCDVSCRVEGVNVRIRRNNAGTAFAPETVEALFGAYEKIPIFGPLIVAYARAHLREAARRRKEKLDS
jgi:hypothetical protein